MLLKTHEKERHVVCFFFPRVTRLPPVVGELPDENWGLSSTKRPHSYDTDTDIDDDAFSESSTDDGDDDDMQLAIQIDCNDFTRKSFSWLILGATIGTFGYMVYKNSIRLKNLL